MAHVDVNELDPEKTVVVATGNPHKVTEIEAILAPVLPGTRFVALGELGDFEDPVEDGDTFEANALIKARAALAEVGLDSVADDSGLVVDALGGAPGILSARWAGTHGDAEALARGTRASTSTGAAPAPPNRARSRRRISRPAASSPMTALPTPRTVIAGPCSEPLTSRSTGWRAPTGSGAASPPCAPAGRRGRHRRAWRHGAATCRR